MTKLCSKRGIFASTTITVLLFSVAAAAVGTTYLYNSGMLSKPPQVEVTNLLDDEVLATGSIELKGTASHENSAIQSLLVRVDGGPPTSIVPNSVNDFSEWSVLLPVSSPGNHTIEVEAIDNVGKTASTTVSVVVKDAGSVVTVPPDQIIEAAGPSGSVVHYPPATVLESARIIDDPDCSPASGSVFPVGTTTVTCTALFASGNLASANFTVSVRDTTAPTIVAPPDVTAENPGLAFMKISLGQPVVNDAVDENPAISNDAPVNGFGLGTTIVVWTVTDDHGNKAKATQKVTVTAATSEDDDVSGSRSNDDGGRTTTYVSTGGGGGGGGGGGRSSGGSHEEPDEDENEDAGGGNDDDGDGASGDATPPTVTATPSGGAYGTSKSVTLSADEPATIYYTKDGTTPTTSSSVYSSSISITATTTLKFVGRDTAGNTSPVYTQTYVIDTVAPTVTAAPAGGTFSSSQSVTLTASEPATIYYTTNGNNPTTSSPIYSSPISIASTTTLKYFAIDTVGNSGIVVTQTYTIDAVDNTGPSVEITDPAEDSEVTATDGEIVVTGTASDSASGIEIVEVRVDDGPYVAATPAAPDDWSSWTVTLEITPGERRLVPRATDNAGNQAWNSIYVTVTNPSGGDSGGSGGDGGGALDDFGIEKIYPTTSGGNEWYVNMDDPDSDPMFRNLPSMTRQSDGSWQVNGGSRGQVRMEAWSPANEKWLNVEITMYAKMVSGSNELLQLYSRGGHHTSSNECLGSAYKARLYGDGEARWVKEVTHPAYTSNRGSVQATDDPLQGRWIGFKAAIYNFVENGKTYVRMESYIDDDVTDSNGNLVIGNNWELASVVEDRGGWSTSNTDFNTSCAPMDKDSTQQYRQRDDILNLPGGTETQNIAAFRSDDLTWNWMHLTVREIVPPS